MAEGTTVASQNSAEQPINIADIINFDASDDKIAISNDSNNNNNNNKTDEKINNNNNKQTNSNNNLNDDDFEMKVAAIDNGLAFPFKHPNEWRACKFIIIIIIETTSLETINYQTDQWKQTPTNGRGFHTPKSHSLKSFQSSCCQCCLTRVPSKLFVKISMTYLRCEDVGVGERRFFCLLRWDVCLFVLLDVGSIVDR